MLEITGRLATYFNRNKENERKSNILQYFLIFIRDVLRLACFDTMITEDSFEGCIFSNCEKVLTFVHEILLSDFDSIDETHCYIADCSWEILDTILTFLKKQQK